MNAWIKPKIRNVTQRPRQYTHNWVYNSGVEFDWDEANEDHVAKHGFTPEDAESVLLDPRALPTPAYNQGGEKRYGIIGVTTGGHILHAAYTYRGNKVRVFHLREANSKEKRRYRR